ncbi:MAG: ARMT1-like domain-containing protein [Candidatus Bathyarchaeia archaeon]
MKLRIECPPCLINRAYVESEKASVNPEVRLSALLEAFRQIGSNIRPDVTPAYLGTIRDRAIKQASNNPDPFKEDKAASNEAALRLMPIVQDYVLNGADESQRLRRACLISIVGNAFEFGIRGYKFNYSDLPELIENAEKDIAIDNIKRFESICESAEHALLLADNAGEIVFDKILVRQLKCMGLRVTVAVKAAPISNDATMEDAFAANMVEASDKVMTTGTDTVGLILEECSREFLGAYAEAGIVIAKGMAHYETLSESEMAQPHIFLFKVKCAAISNDLGVPLGKNVAYLVEPKQP